MSTYGNKRNKGGGGVKRADGSTYQNPGGKHGRSKGRGSHKKHHHPTETIADHWPGYLEGGYFDEDSNLKIEYVSRDYVKPLASSMSMAYPKLTTHQARRFFSHARSIERRLRQQPDAWPELRPRVMYLDEAAADAVGKNPKKIPDLFHGFIKRNVAAIKTRKDFLDGFLPHFEALIAFGSLHMKER